MSRLFCIIVMCAAVLLAGCNRKNAQPEETMTSGAITVLVSEQYEKVMKEEAADFMKSYPDAHITILPVTTRGAIVEMLNDSVKLVCVDRLLNTEETAVAQKAGLEPRMTLIAYDAMAVIVNDRSGVVNMDTLAVQRILEEPGLSWSVLRGRVGGSVIPIATDRNSGTYELLTQTLIPLKKEFIPQKSFTRQRDVAVAVSKDPFSVGFVSTTTVRDSVPGIHAVRLQPSTPEANDTHVSLHQANIYRKFYPYRFGVYLYCTGQRSSLAIGFSVHIASGPGQRLIQYAGLVPATMPVRLMQITNNPIQ